MVVDFNTHTYLRPYLTKDLKLRLSPRVLNPVVYVLCETCKRQTVSHNRYKHKPPRRLEFFRLEFDT